MATRGRIRRPLTPQRRFLVGVVAFAIFAIGLVLMVRAVMASVAFAGDPVCTRALTVATPAAAGRACGIHVGTIADAYQSETQSSRSTVEVGHIDVKAGDGRSFDVELKNDNDGKFYNAALVAIGAKAVVETLNGEPAFIATADGTQSSGADPNFGYLIASVILIPGILLFGLWFRLPKALASARK